MAGRCGSSGFGSRPRISFAAVQDDAPLLRLVSGSNAGTGAGLLELGALVDQQRGVATVVDDEVGAACRRATSGPRSCTTSTLPGSRPSRRRPGCLCGASGVPPCRADRRRPRRRRGPGSRRCCTTPSARRRRASVRVSISTAVCTVERVNGFSNRGGHRSTPSNVREAGGRRRGARAAEDIILACAGRARVRNLAGVLRRAQPVRRRPRRPFTPDQPLAASAPKRLAGSAFRPIPRSMRLRLSTSLRRVLRRNLPGVRGESWS